MEHVRPTSIYFGSRPKEPTRRSELSEYAANVHTQAQIEAYMSLYANVLRKNFPRDFQDAFAAYRWILWKRARDTFRATQDLAQAYIKDSFNRIFESEKEKFTTICTNGQRVVQFPDDVLLQMATEKLSNLVDRIYKIKEIPLTLPNMSRITKDSFNTPEFGEEEVGYLYTYYS